MHRDIGRPVDPRPIDHRRRHHNPLSEIWVWKEGREGKLKEWFDALVGSAFRILSVRWEGGAARLF